MSNEQFTNKTVTTADGKHAREGDRVFDFYDGHWGTIGEIDEQGWFHHLRDEGGRGVLNGERVAFVLPTANPYFEVWLEGLEKIEGLES